VPVSSRVDVMFIATEYCIYTNECAVSYLSKYYEVTIFFTLTPYDGDIDSHQNVVC
jgi:hypothetical protein